jgi:hypothetical protein
MMVRKALLILAFAAVPTVMTAQQPSAPPKAQTSAMQRSDTTKAKAHRRRTHKAKAAAAPRDTTKVKP